MGEVRNDKNSKYCNKIIQVNSSYTSKYKNVVKKTKLLADKSQSITFVINNKKIKFYLDNDWDWYTQPSVFRLRNKERINELSNILETLGFELMKLIHRDIDYQTYLVYCHPMSHESILKSFLFKYQKPINRVGHSKRIRNKK